MFLRFSKFKFVPQQKRILTLSATFLFGTALAIGWNLREPFKCDDATFTQSTLADPSGDTLAALPVYTKDEVSSHRTEATRIWVTYRDGVYDITDFVSSHPGGAKILLAAGGAIDPFWALYGAHKKDEVLELLETMRIGRYHRTAEEKDINDPYAHDPERHPALIIQAAKPFNGETPAPLLLETLTPNDFFYVRNHLPVPVVSEEDYRLAVEQEGVQKRLLTLEELKQFPKVTIEATIQCAGQRRSELKVLKDMQGLNWAIGAISNATWSGARLTDVLHSVGLSRDTIDLEHFKHVHFEGLDCDIERHYGASIPIMKAFDLDGDVLLAYEMNGQPLPRDHGYPVRVVVPGTTGARNVKWLAKINVSDVESTSFWQRRDYKGFGPYVEWATANFEATESIQEFPVNSFIVEPSSGTVIEDDAIEVKGVAISGGGRGIVRVDISPDGGQTWQAAELVPNGQAYNKVWAWTQFHCSIPVSENMKGQKLQICSKAVNSSYDVQPDTPFPLWNIRGVLNNSWHRVSVEVSNE